MKRIVISTILVCTAISVAGGRPPTTTNVRGGVDLRAELFAIIWRLAGSHVYNMGTLEPYVSEIDRHFGPHRDHEAVVRARELIEMGADFSAVMTIAIHTTGPYELRQKVPLEAPGGVLERRGMPESQRTQFASAVRQFREAARDFVEVTRAREFFEAHQPLYDTAGARLRRVIEENADLAWFDDFFGTSPSADFVVVPLLATSEVNFGPSLPGIGVRPERYAFLSTRNDGVDSAGFPVYPVRLVRTLVHEFNHSYVDDLLQDHAHRFAESGPAVFGLVGDRMRAQGYSEWRVVLSEALVDAAVARYVLAHDGPEAARADVAEEQADGHIYMDELFEWLGEYEANRATYPTLDAFMPLLAERFTALVASLTDPHPGSAQRLELDHLFILVTSGAPEARSLEDAGFTPSADTVRHLGQGTASILFRFRNVYLEMLWVHDPQELNTADPALAARLGDAEGDASPFGIALRRVEQGDSVLPFPTRAYRADWMQPGSAIHIAEGQSLDEPTVFVVPDYMSWLQLRDRRSPGAQLRHPNGAERLTSVRVAGPGMAAPSDALRYLVQRGIVQTADSTRHLLELEFDEGRAGKAFDARPTLPLVIHY